MKFLIYIIPIVLIAPAFGMEVDRTEILKLIREYSPMQEVGVSVGVASAEDVLFEDFFGYRNLTTKESIDRETIFGIGSCTKTFTALSTILLAERNGIELQEPIKKYWHQFQLWTSEATEKATLSDLLSHAAGLARYDLLWYAYDFDRKEISRRLRFLRTYAGYFQKKFLYSNLLFSEAAQFGEYLSGEPWESSVRELIFKSLQMRSSHFDPNNFANGNHAQPHVVDKQIPVKDLSNVGPAGSINASLRDLELWIQFHLNMQVGLIKAPNSIHRSVIEVEGYNHPVRYGMGWFREEFHGKRLYRHQGHTDGFSCYLSFMPEENLGIIVLANQHQDKSIEHIALSLYEKFLKLKPLTASAREKYLAWEHQKPNIWRILRDILSSLWHYHAPVSQQRLGAFEHSGFGLVHVDEATPGGFTMRLGKLTAQLTPYWFLSDRLFLARLEAYGKVFELPILFSRDQEKVLLDIPMEPFLGMTQFHKVSD